MLDQTMASAPLDEPPKLRCESPSPDSSPTPALHARPELSRCLSIASSASHGSATTDASHMRESLGSDISAFSRHSSGSYQSSRRSDISNASFGPPLMPLSRQSTGSFDTRSVSGLSRRRGYMRPQATDFAASARSRESVLSLGSIAHLQYYFARTGLLDGKGGQLARKRKQKAQTLDLSALDTSSFLNPRLSGSDVDSSYASMGSSPDLAASSLGGGFAAGAAGVGAGPIVESPIEEHQEDEENYYDDFEEPDPHMLPPTASTYNYREKPLPRPPSIVELKADLTSTLTAASEALTKAKEVKPPESTPTSTPTSSPSHARQPSNPHGTARSPPGWHEIQGMHILDVMTLAIRAAKVYYTAHEQPDRLDAIKSEKQLRSELLTVMDVLKRMATRGFVGGMRDDEFAAMDGWTASVRRMLADEEEMEAAEAAERQSWTWLQDEGWEGRQFEREYAFMESMLAGGGPIVSSAGGLPSPGLSSPIDPAQEPSFPTTAAPSPTAAIATEPLPRWTPIDRSRPASEQELPTPFLEALRSGVRLVHLHNCAVRRSRRRFGAIPTFHTDTQKPYRAADNLRYWAKAAELRWEVLLRLDALAVVNGTPPEAWLEFEDAILAWCRRVREEITADVRAG